MSKSGANAEPSMEEILASIRQIISDDAPENDAEKDQEEPADEASAGADMSESDLDALFATPEPEPVADEPNDQSGIDDIFASVGTEPEPEPAPAMEPNQIDFDAIGVDDDDDDDDEILELSEISPEMAEAPFDPPEDLDFADFEPEPEPEPAPVVEPEPEPVVEPVAQAPEPTPAPAMSAPSPTPDLLSNETSSAVSSAFADLASTMLSGNARTLEDLVQDMLRPMLKSWLDENLPTMVEKMVREEIERVSRRGPRP